MDTTLPRARRLFEEASLVMPGGSTRSTVFLAPHPPYAATAAGYEITDIDGHTLIDLHGNYSTLVHGHRHPLITGAIAEAIENGLSFGLPTESEVLLATELCRRIPAINQLRFTNSGTEAVMMAARVARAFTGRPKILRFKGSYHGTHDAFVDASAPGITAGVSGEVVVVPANEVAFEQAFAKHSENLAAVVMDLMPNRAGLVPMTPELVQLVRTRTEGAGALLILDEIITSRLDTGGLQAAYGVMPDLVTLGKLIGGGLPIGAFGGRSDVMAAFRPDSVERVDHTGTFVANPLTMTAGLAAVKLLDTRAIERLNALGERLRTELQALGFHVNGRGSLARVITDNPHELSWRAYESGLAIAGNGLIALSTPMTDGVIDKIVARFRRVKW